MIVPLHVYTPSCKVFRGLKVNAEMATLLLGGGVTMVMSFPGITGSPSEFNHIAVGMATRPDISSEMMQVRVNSDPAILWPDLLTAAEMRSEGTTDNMVYYMQLVYSPARIKKGVQSDSRNLEASCSTSVGIEEWRSSYSFMLEWGGAEHIIIVLQDQRQATQEYNMCKCARSTISR